MSLPPSPSSIGVIRGPGWNAIWRPHSSLDHPTPEKFAASEELA
jgi:hypothetical protein